MMKRFKYMKISYGEKDSIVKKYQDEKKIHPSKNIKMEKRFTQAKISKWKKRFRYKKISDGKKDSDIIKYHTKRKIHILKNIIGNKRFKFYKISRIKKIHID